MRYRNTTLLTLFSILIGLLVVSFLGGRELFAVGVLQGSGPSKTSSSVSFERYPYLSRQFTRLLDDSRVNCGPGGDADFYAWMADAYGRSSARFPGKENLSLDELLRVKRHDLAAIHDPWRKAQVEIALSAWLHKMIKSTIPKFSLDRGFEFCNVIKRGERQCFLQSVLIAGLLQNMGVDAGVAMVYKNERGEEINNGHAVTLVKLPNGQDIIVDASEPYPFARQQGLFVRHSTYEYVNPVYLANSHRISGYKSVAGQQDMRVSRVRPLDYGFVRSQFYYYRGERAIGGLMAVTKTPEGLEAAAKALRISVGFCPRNPLAVYMLGRVYWAQGKPDQARAYFERAAKLYTRFGYLPEGPKEYLNLARQPQQSAPVSKAPVAPASVKK